MSDGDFVEIRHGDETWRFEPGFLRSNWTCIWGRGCQGIHEVPAPHLGDGCCSVGAMLDGEEEARTIAALAATVADERFQHHEAARVDGAVEERTEGWATRVVDGACIFLNRPGFPGCAGCALQLEATASDESPIDWKPSVCWQLPVHVDWVGDVATVRAWSREDWGEEGETMAWCCTEDRAPKADAYVGDRPVFESLADELTAIAGTEVYVELRRRLTE